jgi:hypothetical protein
VHDEVKRNWKGWGTGKVAPDCHSFVLVMFRILKPQPLTQTLDFQWRVSGNSSPGELTYIVLCSNMKREKTRGPLFLNWETISPLILNSWESDKICLSKD